MSIFSYTSTHGMMKKTPLGDHNEDDDGDNNDDADQVLQLLLCVVLRLNKI